MDTLFHYQTILTCTVYKTPVKQKNMARALEKLNLKTIKTNRLQLELYLDYLN